MTFVTDGVLSAPSSARQFTGLPYDAGIPGLVRVAVPAGQEYRMASTGVKRAARTAGYNDAKKLMQKV